MISKLEEIINQIIKEKNIPQEKLVELLEATLRLLPQFPQIAEHPSTVIERITYDQELNRKMIKIYYDSLIKTLRKFVNMLAYHWKTVQLTNQSPETTIQTKQVILDELINFLTLFEKEHIHLLRHIAELESYSGDIERADEYIFKAIWQDIQGECLDKEATEDLATLLANSSGDYKNRLISLKERFSKVLKEPTFVIQKIEEIEKETEKIIARPEFIKRTTEEIKQTIEVIKQTIGMEHLDLKDLSLKVEYLCKHIDAIGKIREETKKELPIPIGKINDECLEPIFKKVSILPKDSQKECIRILLKINDRLLKYFSSKDSKKFMNLFDRIEYLRLHKDIWEDFGFRECVREAYELGEKIYANISSHSEYLDKRKLEAFLGKLGEIYGYMVEFQICNPAEERGLLLKSIDFLQTPIIAYFGRHYSRIGHRYMDLEQWEDAIRYFIQIKDIDETKTVNKKIAFDVRIMIADCYLKLGIEAKKYGDIEGTSQNFKSAEEFYNKADELRIGPEDGRHLIGKQADFYYLSQQYKKALPLYEEIMRREVSASSDEKNLYDYFSYRRGECLYEIGETEESIKQFETTLERNPEAKHKIKSYVRLIKLYGIKHNEDKLNEIKERMISDKEIQDIGIPGIPTDKLEILLMADKMEEYIAQIDDKLARGEAWAVINELEGMKKLHSLIEGERDEDPIFLTKIAEANIRVGDYGLAIETLHHVMELDRRPKNQAQALAYIGRAYTAQGKYTEAIEAFQKSFVVGGDIGMLVLEAAAFCKLKEYGRSIEIYEQILQSGKDKKPNITKTGLAKTYWDKYQYEGKKEDLEKSLSQLADVIRGYPEDWRACSLLVRISNNTNVFNLIESLIVEGPITVSINILMGLTADDLFPDKAIHACLKRLSSIEPINFVQSSVDFLMKATIYSYFFLSEDFFNKTLKDILSSILSINNWHIILKEYLCAEKGAYPNFFEKVYATQVEAILKPLSTQNIDSNPALLQEIIRSVRDFIQSEIPQGLGVNYKGLESKGVNFTAMLLTRRKEVNLEINGYPYIFTSAINKQASMEIPYPAWYMYEKLVAWFYPLPKADGWTDETIWATIFSHSNIVTVHLTANGTDSIEVKFTAKLDYSTEKADQFKTAFEIVRNNHRGCPIPKIMGFQYGFSESLNENENYGILEAQIKIPKCITLDKTYPKLMPFLEYMVTTFKDGLNGAFNPNEYHRQANSLFPKEIGMELGQWTGFIHTYLDHHFGLLFDVVLRNSDYRKTVHDYIKGPLERMQISSTLEQKEITDFLINIERLPWELGRVRRRTLEPIRGESSLRKLNIERLLEQLINDLQEKNTEINFEFFPAKSNKLVEGIKPLFERVFTNLYNNAIFATRTLSRSKISTFIFEEGGYCVISIQNSYKENMPSAPFSTGIGLESAKYIIKNEHKGEINTFPDPRQGIFITTVKLPLAI